MQAESVNIQDKVDAQVLKSDALNEGIGITGSYDVACIGADGQVKWTDTIKNLVVTAGRNDLLDKYFAGSAYTAAWYMGLVDGATSPTYAATDTLATHAGWTEFTSYSGSNRITVSWNAASAGSKATTSTSFSISGSGTVAGALMTVTQAKATTTGVLYSAGNFTGGSRAVVSGDTLLVTYTAATS